MTKLLLPIAMLLLSTNYFSCAGSQKKPIVHTENFLPVKEKVIVKPNFPKVISHTLSNGFTVLIVQEKGLPIAQVSIVFKNGSARDPVLKPGLINLTAQMLKEGTRDLSSLELAEAFANLGTEVSIDVSKDYSLMSTAVLSNKIDKAISLLAAMSKEPRFHKDEFTRLKAQQQSSIISDQGDPSYLAQVTFLRSAYGEKHPYAHPKGGTQEGVSRIKLKDIKSAYKSNFGPNNAALVVVGNVDEAQIIELAKKYFGDWHKIKEPRLEIKAPHKTASMQTILVEVPNTPQTYLMVGQPAVQRKDKDLASYEVLLSILARNPTSRLGEKLREEKGWTYGVKGFANPLRGLGPVWISSSIQVPHGAEALGEILSAFEKVRNAPVSDAELNAAKDNLLHSFAGRYSTVAKVAHQISDYFVYDLPLNSDENYYDNLSKVSKNDVMNAAKKAFNKEHLVNVAVGDLDAIESPIKQMNVGKVRIENAETAIAKPKKSGKKVRVNASKRS